MDVEGIVFESLFYELEVGLHEETYCEEPIFSFRCASPDRASQMAEAACQESSYVTVDIARLRKAGVPEYIISMILDNQVELSPLRITHNARLLLTGYGLEVKMPPLDKALYFLFLRHPEGIRFKELRDYRDELSELYSSVTGRDDIGQIENSIDSLTDPLNNSVNEKCSRIKRAFTKALSDGLAKEYYIDGKGGEPKSIAIDRSLVTWETETI